MHRSSDFHNSNLFSEHLGTHCTLDGVKCNENVIWVSVLRLDASVNRYSPSSTRGQKMAVRSTQCQNKAVRSTQGGSGCHSQIEDLDIP